MPVKSSGVVEGEGGGGRGRREGGGRMGEENGGEGGERGRGERRQGEGTYCNREHLWSTYNSCDRVELVSGGTLCRGRQ